MASEVQAKALETIATVNALTVERLSLKEQVVEISARLDAAIAIEDTGDDVIDAVKADIDGLSLTGDLADLVAVGEGLKEKIALYKAAVAENTEGAASVYEAIAASSVLIDEIKATVAEISANIADIQSGLPPVEAA